LRKPETQFIATNSDLVQYIHQNHTEAKGHHKPHRQQGQHQFDVGRPIGGSVFFTLERHTRTLRKSCFIVVVHCSF
tara:strand:+ start:135737 stop:135964 length:228 start_codon:yes stop_codon:yes gene_type:complete